MKLCMRLYGLYTKLCTKLYIKLCTKLYTKLCTKLYTKLCTKLYIKLYTKLCIKLYEALYEALYIEALHEALREALRMEALHEALHKAFVCARDTLLSGPRYIPDSLYTCLCQVYPYIHLGSHLIFYPSLHPPYLGRHQNASQ